MDEGHVRLPVGYFSRDGSQVQYEEVQGPPLAEHEGRMSAEDARDGRVLQLKERLYGSREGGPYVVHTVLELAGEHQPFLGRLEHYQRWAEVMLHHPDLARSAGFMRERSPRSTSESDEAATPGWSSEDRSLELEDGD